MTLHTYDVRATQPDGILSNVPIELYRKRILIYIEVVNPQLDYNLLCGHSYMYVVKAVASSIFQLMIFPHDWNIVKLEKLTYYDPRGPACPENVSPMIDNTISSSYIPYFYQRLA